MKLAMNLTGKTLVALFAVALTCQVHAQEDAAQQEGPKTIAESIDPGTFSTLYHAVNSAGLAETLKGDGPFTVFAPSDAAFGTLPLGDVQNLFQPANKELLAAILKHHVVQGKVMAADVAGMTEAKSVLGDTLKIEANDDGVMINGVKVSTTDIECSNGVIHVIDGVFMPSEEMMNKVKESMKAAAEKAAADAKAAAEKAAAEETKKAAGEGSGSK